VTPAPATISDELWATFPAAARAIVVSLLEPNATLEARVVQLEAQVADLTAKLNRNSSNSSLPPSANPLHAKPAPPKPKSGKRRGGQIGHPKNERVLLPPDEIIAIKPRFVANAAIRWRARIPYRSCFRSKKSRKSSRR